MRLAVLLCLACVCGSEGIVANKCAVISVVMCFVSCCH